MNRVGQFILWAVVVSLAAWGATQLYAGEHPGTTKEHAGETKEHADTKERAGETKEHADKEHAGTTTGHTEASKEHAGAAKEHVDTKEHAGASKEHAGKTVEPTHEEIRMAMRTHALSVVNQNRGHFPIFDERIGKERKLSFVRVHQRVGKLSTRDGYFSCSDFVDQQTGETLDVDFWVTMKGGKLTVTDAEIHKVNGRARFTYNEKDEKIMLN